MVNHQRRLGWTTSKNSLTNLTRPISEVRCHHAVCFVRHLQKEIVFNRNWKYIWTASLIRKVLIHEMIHLHIHYKYKKVGRWLNSFHHMWPFAYEWWKLNWKYHLGLKLLEPIPIKGISKGT